MDAPAGRLSETLAELVPTKYLRALPDAYHYGCGCRTLASLMEWFLPAERARLRAFGFFPVKLQADDIVAESRWQLVFARVHPFTDGATRLNWPTR